MQALFSVFVVLCEAVEQMEKKVVELPICCTHSLTLSIWPSLFLFWASPGGTDKIKNKYIYICIKYT